MSDPLLVIADELYGLPLAYFTPSRDAVAKEHRADRSRAVAVKALRKPSVAAWVVNLLVRRDPEQVQQVLEVGVALREAQGDLDTDQLRELTRQRRQLTAAVTTAARRLAREEGVKVTRAVADQVEATLTAAMIDADAARAVRSGLLVSSVSATGLGDLDLSGAVALPAALGFAATARKSPSADPGANLDPEARPQLRVVPDPEAEAKARAAADAEVTNAEQVLGEAETASTELDTRAEELEARTLQLQSEMEELRGRLAQLEDQLETVDEELAGTEEARSEATSRITEAEAAVRAARQARERLG